MDDFREPFTYNITDLKSSKDNPTCGHEITTEYSSFCFMLNLFSKAETNREYSLPIPPMVPKMSGVKLPCSTSKIISLYSRVFFFLLLTKHLRYRLVFIGLRVNARNSYVKNSVCPLLQKSLAFISKRVPFSVLETWYWNFSVVTGSKQISTFMQTLSSNAVKKSRMLLCLTKPPFLQDRVCIELFSTSRIRW